MKPLSLLMVSNTLKNKVCKMTNKKKIVVLSGAGISQESGIATFRDSSDGLWNNYNIYDVCTPEAWEKNPTLVNDFYNMRRIEMLNAQPNRAHKALAEIEELYDVQIITTNVDDLHERGGSTNVLHLHGNLNKARSSRNGLGSLPNYLLEPHLVDVGREGITNFQEAADGFLLRPHVVFFHEDVPELGNAADLVREADILIVVGTSLSVYPANTLVSITKDGCKVFFIDPSTDPDAGLSFPCRFYNAKATVGIPSVIAEIARLEEAKTGDVNEEETT